MSAFESITSWVEDEVDLDCDQTVDQNFKDIDKMFTDEYRNHLQDILKDDLPDFMIWLANKQQLDCEEFEEFDRLDSELDKLLDQADKLLASLK